MQDVVSTAADLELNLSTQLELDDELNIVALRSSKAKGTTSSSSADDSDEPLSLPLELCARLKFDTVLNAVADPKSSPSVSSCPSF